MKHYYHYQNPTDFLDLELFQNMIHIFTTQLFHIISAPEASIYVYKTLWESQSGLFSRIELVKAELKIIMFSKRYWQNKSWPLGRSFVAVFLIYWSVTAKYKNWANSFFETTFQENPHKYVQFDFVLLTSRLPNMIADVMAFSSTIFVLIPNLVLLFKVKMTNPVFLFVSYCITTKAPKVSSISKSHKTWTGSKHLCASRSLQHQHRLHAPCLCDFCTSASLFCS